MGYYDLNQVVRTAQHVKNSGPSRYGWKQSSGEATPNPITTAAAKKMPADKLVRTATPDADAAVRMSGYKMRGRREQKSYAVEIFIVGFFGLPVMCFILAAIGAMFSPLLASYLLGGCLISPFLSIPLMLAVQSILERLRVRNAIEFRSGGFQATAIFATPSHERLPSPRSGRPRSGLSSQRTRIAPSTASAGNPHGT